MRYKEGMPLSDRPGSTGERSLFERACHDLARQVLEQVSASGERPLTLSLPELPGTAFEFLSETFELSAFERAVLLFAATMELQTASLLLPCAVELNFGEDITRAFLSPYTLGQWLGSTDPAAFQASAALRASALIQLRPSGFEQSSDVLSALRITPGALGYLLGAQTVSAEGQVFLEALGDGGRLGASQRAAVHEIEGLMHGSPAGSLPVMNVYGDRQEGLLEVCQALSVGPRWLLRFDRVVRAVQQERFTPDEVLGIVQRDLTLTNATLVVALEDRGPGEADERGVTRLGSLGWTEQNFVQELCARLRTPVVLLSRTPVSFAVPQDVYALSVEAPSAEEQTEFWMAAMNLGPLQASVVQLRASLRQVTTQFSLSASKIETVARDAHRHLQQRADPDAQVSLESLLSEVWEACKRQGRKAFQGIADRMVSCASWEQLVLPPEDLDSLREIIEQVQHRHTVYDAWGYGAQERGLGITVLFSGTSGGGKTFAAEVMANTLNLDLYRIDLSSVTSKWIGETEKNLRRIFDAADEGGAILLFDEADSVFGKRGAVQSSNDRYANLTTNYLLQRLEAYRGLAILTTNFEGNIDAAFMRRIRFQVRFQEPDERLRAQLWQRAFPAGVRTEMLDYAALARVKLTGASIRSVALGATFMAAAQHTPVTPVIVQEVIRRELRRQGRLMLAEVHR
ncbi:AAA+ family ATPase [Deinococcus peraridilitoris DSM 19664]|uniref:AAA+ family ATPase n=2 Tax=Deinococcus TaxID=1298 RepID=L0A2R6_DEIPD|nr:AAA+ family ATPase [Deinococcus peraridilitoris DSM 19664]